MPADAQEMTSPLHRYAVKQDYSKYPDTTGVVLTCGKFIGWLRQLLSAIFYISLHVDGKHKLHYGECIGMP